MTHQPHILEEATWRQVRSGPREVAVLPWGATEPHNYHLPYGTDTIQSRAVAAEAARLAVERGASVMVLPGIPFGVQTGQLDLPFSLNVNPSTQLALLRDLARSLSGQGVKKLVILNGHGGNDFRAIIRELQPRAGLFLSLVNWYSCVDPRPFFEEPGDHAGELETSVMLSIAPELVRPLSEAGPGVERHSRMQAFREGWAWTPRPWSQVTDDTGVGDPRAATAAKGAAFLQAVCERIAAFLVELSQADPAAMYE